MNVVSKPAVTVYFGFHQIPELLQGGVVCKFKTMYFGLRCFLSADLDA